jgi:hypothetical protein
MTSLSFLISMLLLVQINQPNKYLIDLEKRTIAGIRGDDSIEQIRRKVGKANIRQITGKLEDQPIIIYVISIGGHEITKDYGAFAVEDSIFRTKEGLRVGSRIADFAKYYPELIPSDSDEEYLTFMSADEKTQFMVKVGDGCNQRLSNGEIPGDCIVKEIRF